MYSTSLELLMQCFRLSVQMEILEISFLIVCIRIAVPDVTDFLVLSSLFFSNFTFIHITPYFAPVIIKIDTRINTATPLYSQTIWFPTAVIT